MQRYQVDLSDFFSDHRQKVFVGKRDKWKAISCLVKHIGAVFGLNGIYLTNGDGVLFLEDDNLDVIRESDWLRVHSSNSLKAAQEICAPKRVAAKDGSRASVMNQNGKRKRESSPNVKHMHKETSSSSGTESDDEDDDTDVLPKIFVELESVSKKDETFEEIPKPKRKRIRKRKSKKQQDPTTPQKVVVKTYGKGKVPAIVNENGIASQHIRFSKDAASDDENEIQDKNESYRNLNQNTVARVVKAVLQPSEPMTLNEDIIPPSIPDYLDDLNMDQTVANSNSKQSKRKQKKSLAIKQELIEANTIRASSPTWDSELDKAKEDFLSNYTGQDFWNNLQEALVNFPAITIPSVNDIIAYRLIAEDRLSYLAFVERADEGDSYHCPAMKLKLRRLNTCSPPSALITTTYTLDQLMEIRLVASYQP